MKSNKIRKTHFILIWSVSYSWIYSLRVNKYYATLRFASVMVAYGMKQHIKSVFTYVLEYIAADNAEVTD